MCTIVCVQIISKYYLPFTLSKQFLPSKYSYNWLLNRIYKIIYTHDLAVLCAFVMILSFILDSCDSCIDVRHGCVTGSTVYPKKYAHGFVVLCFVVVMQSFIMNSHEVFIHIHQSCFAGTGAIVRLPQGQWSKPDGYGKISQCITTTKHSKAKTVCIFLVIYCRTIIVFPQCEWSNLSRHGFDRPYHNHTKQQQKREPCSLFLGLPYLSSSLDICETTDEIKHYVHCQHSLYENRIRCEGSLPDH